MALQAFLAGPQNSPQAMFITSPALHPQQFLPSWNVSLNTGKVSCLPGWRMQSDVQLVPLAYLLLDRVAVLPCCMASAGLQKPLPC